MITCQYCHGEYHRLGLTRHLSFCRVFAHECQLNKRRQKAEEIRLAQRQEQRQLARGFFVGTTYEQIRHGLLYNIQRNNRPDMDVTAFLRQFQHFLLETAASPVETMVVECMSGATVEDKLPHASEEEKDKVAVEITKVEDAAVEELTRSWPADKAEAFRLAVEERGLFAVVGGGGPPPTPPYNPPPLVPASRSVESGEKPSPPAGSLFGSDKPSAPAGSLVGSDKPSPPAGSLFASDKPAGYLFGSDKPAGSLFGSDKQAGYLFGSDKPAGSLFGSDKPAGSLFGSGKTFAEPVTRFGWDKPSTPASKSSLFGVDWPSQFGSDKLSTFLRNA